jgi:hypothetical protein
VAFGDFANAGSGGTWTIRKTQTFPFAPPAHRLEWGETPILRARALFGDAHCPKGQHGLPEPVSG